HMRCTNLWARRPRFGTPPLRSRSAPSGRAHGAEKFFYLKLEMIAFAGQGLRGRQNLRRGRAGFARATIDVRDVGRDLRGAMSRLLNVARDLLRCRALLLNGGGNRRSDLRDALDGRSDFLDGANRVLSGRLH